MNRLYEKAAKDAVQDATPNISPTPRPMRVPRAAERFFRRSTALAIPPVIKQTTIRNAMNSKEKIYGNPKAALDSIGSMDDSNRIGVITNGTAVKPSVMTKARRLNGVRSAPHCVHTLVSFGFSKRHFLQIRVC